MCAGSLSVSEKRDGLCPKRPAGEDGGGQPVLFPLRWGVLCRETQVWVQDKLKENKCFQPLVWSSPAREALWTSTPS